MSHCTDEDPETFLQAALALLVLSASQTWMSLGARIATDAVVTGHRRATPVGAGTRAPSAEATGAVSSDSAQGASAAATSAVSSEARTKHTFPSRKRQ